MTILVRPGTDSADPSSSGVDAATSSSSCSADVAALPRSSNPKAGRAANPRTAPREQEPAPQQPAGRQPGPLHPALQQQEQPRQEQAQHQPAYVAAMPMPPPCERLRVAVPAPPPMSAPGAPSLDNAAPPPKHPAGTLIFKSPPHENQNPPQAQRAPNPPQEKQAPNPPQHKQAPNPPQEQQAPNPPQVNTQASNAPQAPQPRVNLVPECMPPPIPKQSLYQSPPTRPTPPCDQPQPSQSLQVQHQPQQEQQQQHQEQQQTGSSSSNSQTTGISPDMAGAASPAVAGADSGNVSEVVRGLLPENRECLQMPGWSGQWATVTPMAFFQSFSAFNHHWSRHNEALKWIRDEHELYQTPFNTQPFLVPENLMMKECARFPKNAKNEHNMDYFFTNRWVAWNWKEMVAQLDETSMQYVVCGPQGRSGGLVCCFCEVTPHSYDGKRHKLFKEMKPERFQQVRPQMQKSDVPKLPEWDFLIIREDLTAVRLHPENSKPTFRAREQQIEMPPSHVPGKGIGKSDGRGCFRRCAIHADSMKLRFDHNKGPW